MIDLFERYRQRASALNRYYSERYRGAFLLNYLFAAAAVLLAVCSLLVVVASLSRPRWSAGISSRSRRSAR